MARIRLSSKATLPRSVKEAQAAYKKAAKGLLGKAYFGQISERFQSMKKDFKVHKAIGVIFTILGVRTVSDYLKSRRSLRSKLDIIGHTLSAELARDPVLRKAITDVSKKYPYLSVNKNGEIFVSSYSGTILDKSTIMGMVFNPEYSTPQHAETNRGNKAFGQKLDLNLILSMGNPKFEAAKVTSRGLRGAISAAKNVTAAINGDKEIRIFSRSAPGVVPATTKETILTQDIVKSTKLFPSKTAGKKIVSIRVEEKGKPSELIQLELDAKKADAIYRGFVVKR